MFTYIPRFLTNQNTPSGCYSISLTGKVGGRVVLLIHFVQNEKGIWPEWTFPDEPPWIHSYSGAYNDILSLSGWESSFTLVCWSGDEWIWLGDKLIFNLTYPDGQDQILGKCRKHFFFLLSTLNSYHVANTRSWQIDSSSGQVKIRTTRENRKNS